jgi:hypothetical protein
MSANELHLPQDCLAVFVDDTGHDQLVRGHPVYGLGGCAGLSQDLDRVIRGPWRAIRQAVAGLPDAQLHASEFGHTNSRKLDPTSSVADGSEVNGSTDQKWMEVVAEIT